MAGPDPESMRRLIDALLRMPGVESKAVRNALLFRIPQNVIVGLNRSGIPAADIVSIITDLERLGRLDNGERPIVIVTQNALRTTAGTALGHELAQLQQEIEAAYDEERPLDELPDHPEILVSGGTGEWVTTDFIRQAELAGTRVGRLLVPRFTEGYRDSGPGGIGTGWLVAPGLLLTNHHVIEARTAGEAPASAADLARQAAHTRVWFDYHVEGGSTVQVSCGELLVASPHLDYALLSVGPPDELAGRGHAVVTAVRPVLRPGTRLNIVQCPGGGPLRYAIRNNFFAGTGGRDDRIRYVTDTQRGSSGAPVFDDSWQVVAMHRGHRKISPLAYAGEGGSGGVVRYHNEGIVLTDIIDDLPRQWRQAIHTAQGWC